MKTNEMRIRKEIIDMAMIKGNENWKERVLRETFNGKLGKMSARVCLFLSFNTQDEKKFQNKRSR